MHIPDGFLDIKTTAVTATLAGAGLLLSLKLAQKIVSPARMPLMGLASAFIFAAQMLNFPVVGGTSGHLMGSVLAAVLLGPAPATVVMSVVLLVQCFLFSDGGLLALGANILNMAIIAVVGGYSVFRLVHHYARSIQGKLLAAIFASWCSTVLASLACAGELAVSGIAPWRLLLLSMSGIHMIIGLGEGIITGLALFAIHRSRPELLGEASDPTDQKNLGSLIGAGLIFCVSLALFASPLASTWPDGLESVSQSLGFEHQAKDPALSSPMPDYQFPWFHSSTIATALAGLIGTLTAFILSWLLSRRLISPKR